MTDTLHKKNNHTMIILLLGALTAIGPFSIDMYLPGFPAIAKDFHINIALVGLSLTSYFFGISIGQLIYGPLTDRFGRKKPLLVGLVIYLISAIGCGLSLNIYSLILFRLFLALGGCVGLVASRAVVRDLFPPHETAGVFSLLMLVMGISPVIAPTVGGLVSQHFGWRGIFALLVLFSAALIVATLFRLPESRGHDRTVSLKLHHIIKEYWIILKNREFLVFTLAGGISFGAMFAYIAGGPFVFMEHYRLDQTQFGLVFGANACALILGSQINRFLLKKQKVTTLIYIPSAVQIVTALLLVILTLSGLMNAILLLSLIFCYMFCQGFLNPNTAALALRPFDRTAGFASALMGSIQMVISAGATALVTILFNNTILPMIGIMSSAVALSFLLLCFYYFKMARSAAPA